MSLAYLELRNRDQLYHKKQSLLYNQNKSSKHLYKLAVWNLSLKPY